MNRFFTSDLHLGHVNILRYCPDRPWDTVEEMNEGLIERWNATVRPGDQVFVLGDFAMGPRAETVPLAKRLHGTKVLLPGNHDYCWQHHRSSRGLHYWRQLYFEAGFDHVLMGDTMRFHLGPRNVPILMCHFPYPGSDARQREMALDEYLPVDQGKTLVHGHVHNLWQTTISVEGSLMINVGVDAWDFQPVAEERLVEIVEGGF